MKFYIFIKRWEILEKDSHWNKPVETKEKITHFNCKYFSVLMTLYFPCGVNKKAKGSTESQLLLSNCKPILKEKSLIDKGNNFSLI